MKSNLTAYFTAFYLIALPIYAFSQPSIGWVARYNGTGSRTDNARLLEVDNNNNIYVAGASDGAKGAGWDITVVKYNASGAQEWVGRFNGSGNGNDYPFGMTVDIDGNVYVTGRSFNKSGNDDIALVKFLANGSMHWSKQIDGETHSNDFGRDVKVDNNGNVILASVRDGANSFNGNKITLFKFDGNGNSLWSNSVDYNNLPDLTDGSAINKEEVTSIAIDNDGNIYLAGESEGFLTLKFNSSGELQWQRNLGGTDARKIKIDTNGDVIVAGWGSRVAKYSANGDLLWTSVYNSPFNTTAAFQDLEVDLSGNIYLAGYTSVGTGTQDWVIVKYASTGTLLWDDTYGGSANRTDFARGITIDPNGNVIATGVATFLKGRGEVSNYITIKYNQTGDQQWIARYEAEPGDAFGIGSDNVGNVYVTGQMTAKTYTDFVTIKYNNDAARLTSPVNSETKEFLLSNISIAPNPVKDILIIRHNTREPEPLLYQVYNTATNMMIRQGKFMGSTQVNLNKEKFGTYIINIYSEKTGAELRKLFIKE